MPLPRFARNVALVVARAVAQDDLFEKPGERGRTPPLPPPGGSHTEAAPAAAAAGGAAVARDASAAAGPAAPARPRRGRVKGTAAASDLPVLDPVRPSTGCRPVSLAGLRAALAPAGKPLVINHWATWCDPCVDELPRLVRAAAGVADIGEFLGVSWDLFDHPADPEVAAKKVAAFADSVGVGYGSVLFVGDPKELFAALGLTSELIPQTHVIAPDGTVSWSKLGIIEHDDVFPLIRAVKAAAGVA